MGVLVGIAQSKARPQRGNVYGVSAEHGNNKEKQGQDRQDHPEDEARPVFNWKNLTGKL
jgi:hypothetical protein